MGAFLILFFLLCRTTDNSLNERSAIKNIVNSIINSVKIIFINNAMLKSKSNV